MQRLRMIGIVAGGVIAAVIVAIAGGFAYARATVDSVLERTWDTHTIDFPVPWPLTADEMAELGDESAEDVARRRAEARGQHLVQAIYGCASCHGPNLAGGTMMDDGAIMVARGPNLTPGSRVDDFTVSDWDRSVRHGVLPDGTTSIMPVGDYAALSDRELSDIIAYLRSLPAAPDALPRAREFGPVGVMLVGTGMLVPDVYGIEDHHRDHISEPPPSAPTVEYGEHIAQTCTGCHRKGFEGGPMPFGPPEWPPAANLTPHDAGLASYTFEAFREVMKTGRRPDSSMVKAPMDEVVPFTARQTDTELRALWAFFRSLPPTPTGP